MFEHGRSNKSLGTSEYCRREAIFRVLESLLCKVLPSFGNSGLINGTPCIPSVLQVWAWAASIILSHCTKNEVFNKGFLQ